MRRLRASSEAEMIWRGASWSRNLLIGLSCVSAGFAVGLAVAIALGATGIVTSALVMFACTRASAGCCARRRSAPSRARRAP
jgi:hypothetical protein